MVKYNGKHLTNKEIINNYEIVWDVKDISHSQIFYNVSLSFIIKIDSFVKVQKYAFATSMKESIAKNRIFKYLLLNPDEIFVFQNIMNKSIHNYEIR